MAMRRIEPDFQYALELFRPATRRWERMGLYYDRREAMDELTHVQRRLTGEWRVRREPYMTSLEMSLYRKF